MPILKGGQAEPVLQQAITLLRADPALSELEPLLAFFASFVLDTGLIRRLMRWDMAVLRESPWYQEILEEGIAKGLERGLEQGLEQGLERGLEQGLERGRREMARSNLLRVLTHRFGAVPADVQEALIPLAAPDLERLLDLALDLASIDEFRRQLPPRPHPPA